MKILFSPVDRAGEFGRIRYTFEDETVTVVLPDGSTDMFDFSKFPDGKLSEEGVKTILTDNVLKSAERVDGELFLVLRNYVGPDSTEEERFPKWIDHKEYVQPTVKLKEDSEEAV